MASDYKLVKYVEEGTITVAHKDKYLFTVPIEEWTYIIANPEIIQPEEERAEVDTV